MQRNTHTILAALATLTFVASLALPALATNDKNRSADRTGAIPRQQVRVWGDGQVQLDGMKVTAISPAVSATALPASITATATWGSTVFTWVIKTSSSTKFLRLPQTSSGEPSVSVGDMLSVKGTLDITQTAPTVNASWIQDWNILPIHKARYRGTITELNTVAKSFMLIDPIPNPHRPVHAPITVQASDSTVIKRGDGEIDFNNLLNGEAASVSGSFNSATSTLLATEITVKAPKPQVWNGILKSIAGTVKPTNLVATINGLDHTVNVNTNTAVLNYWWYLADLADFAVGHRLQIFGTLLPNVSPMPVITATVVRNLSLH